jgi:hypothetical protein
MVSLNRAGVCIGEVLSVMYIRCELNMYVRRRSSTGFKGLSLLLLNRTSVV